MRKILILSALLFTACVDSATLPVDALPDSKPGPVATWPLCPSGWGPGSDIAYVGSIAGRDCFETSERPDLLPCRYDSGAIIVVSTGVRGAACGGL